MLQSRFAEALALDERSAVATEEERAVALYRLGCYRSVTALDVKARSAPASVAVAASLAACGKADDAEMVIHGAQAQGLLPGRFLHSAVRALAPFQVGLAAELASDLPGAPGLRCRSLDFIGRLRDWRGDRPGVLRRQVERSAPTG